MPRRTGVNQEHTYLRLTHCGALKKAAIYTIRSAMLRNMCKLVDGFLINGFLQDENVRSALNYSAKPGDLFVVSYPKCGTTWTQYIAFCILNKGQPPEDYTDFMLRSPFLELLGAESVHRMTGQGPIKTHFPFDRQPQHPESKYIYVTRNPYDCCVSYFHHVRNSPVYNYSEATFDMFFDVFLEGKVSCGDYFDHLLSWYEHRKDPNVLFITYESLKDNTAASVLKIADFIGDQYGEELRSNPNLYSKITDMVSASSMRKAFSQGIKSIMPNLLALPPEKALKSVEVYREVLSKKRMSSAKSEFIRKGVVGDWKNYFQPDHIERMKAWITLKTQGSDVMQLWADCGLP
uniref:Putative sulfotransferase ixodes scapularis sulfotransferase n=1 Tax=Amblyomma triste TaxID=251400 RepID=A0A023G6L5_AMBTT